MVFNHQLEIEVVSIGFFLMRTFTRSIFECYGHFLFVFFCECHIVVSTHCQNNWMKMEIFSKHKRVLCRSILWYAHIFSKILFNLMLTIIPFALFFCFLAIMYIIRMNFYFHCRVMGNSRRKRKTLYSQNINERKMNRMDFCFK